MNKEVTFSEEAVKIGKELRKPHLKIVDGYDNEIPAHKNYELMELQATEHAIEACQRVIEVLNGIHIVKHYPNSERESPSVIFNCEKNEPLLSHEQILSLYTESLEYLKSIIK